MRRPLKEVAEAGGEGSLRPRLWCLQACLPRPPAAQPGPGATSRLARRRELHGVLMRVAAACLVWACISSLVIG